MTNIPDEEANRIKNVLKDNSRDRPVFFLQDQYKWKEKDKQETQQDYEGRIINNREQYMLFIFSTYLLSSVYSLNYEYPPHCLHR